jgi:hypothetical protein
MDSEREDGEEGEKGVKNKKKTPDKTTVLNGSATVKRLRACEKKIQRVG